MPSERVEARILRLGAAGDGIAEVGGGPVFVPGAAPGDRAAFRIVEEKAGVRRAADVVLGEEGPHRAAPPCPHFGLCGGCAVQHLSDGFVAAWKRGLIVEALQKRGFVDPPVAETLTVPMASRRRAVFSWRRAGKDGALGFQERARHRVVAIGPCPILVPLLEYSLPVLKAVMMRSGVEEARLTVTALDDGLDVALDMAHPDEARLTAAFAAAAEHASLKRLSLHGETLLQFEPPRLAIGACMVTPPPGAFLQASREGEEALAGAVLEWTHGAKRVADLFCGVGTFALRLAPRAEVHAADQGREAVAAMKAAWAAAGGLRPLKAQARDLVRRPLSAKELAGLDAVVFDPPRAGAKAQAEALAASAVPRVVAVSCNPATFARDARILAEGGYRLVEARPVDQFRYAAHVELAALFVRD